MLPPDRMGTINRERSGAVECGSGRPIEDLPTQAELLEVWGIREEDAAVAPPIVRIVVPHDEEAEPNSENKTEKSAAAN